MEMKTPIYYRDDKFFPIETGYYLYPEAVPGYEGSFNNARTKSYTFGVFDELSTVKRVIVVSTHLWWKSGNPSGWKYQRPTAIAQDGNPRPRLELPRQGRLHGQWLGRLYQGIEGQGTGQQPRGKQAAGSGVTPYDQPPGSQRPREGR